MGVVSRWAVNRPWQAIIVWVVLLFVMIGGVVANAATGDKFNNSFTLQGTDSATAQNLLASKFGSETGNASVQILFRSGDLTIGDPQTEKLVKELTKKIEALGSVASVQTPYDAKSAQAAVESGLMSTDGNIGKLNVIFKTPDTQVPLADGKAIVADVTALDSTAMTVGAAGTVIGNATGKTPESEIVGIIAAILIMLIMFGSVVAAGLPLVTALLGLTAGLSLLIVATNFVSMASFAPTLAAMIGLGVGFDYSLFLLNRYRQAVLAGSEPKDAALIAVATAGRAIVFAALTVIIALSGLFVLGMSFLNGLAVGAGVTVICMMVTAVTLLPAMISLLGPRVFAWKMPWGRKPATAVRGRRFRTYAEKLEQRRWLAAVLALAFMILLAIPTLSMREGFPDAGGNPPNDPQRTAYYLTAQGFGVGANGPFIVVAELPNAASVAKVEALSKAIADNPDVAFASPVKAGTATVSKDGTAALITVIPKSAPQAAATTDLLDTLRTKTIPDALQGSGVKAYVGGANAVAEDFSAVLSSKLPQFLLVVVGLGFLVLMVLFRSLLIPLTAAITALISYGAALGVSVFVFQWGNLKFLFGIPEAGPILPFVPVMMFAILFGLSMDYQVFLVSRMQEEWETHKDNKRAVRVGLGSSGLVVVAAAAIMFCVFMSFVFQDNATIKLFGLSLAVAVALDAFVIRLVFVPALMTILGPANWYLPKWLGKVLPKVSVEGPATKDAAPEPEPEPVSGPAR